MLYIHKVNVLNNVQKKQNQKKKKKTVFNNLHIDSFVIPFFQLNL